MKILMVAIPNHHFFKWVNQLEQSGHDVLWFDITDGGPKSPQITWVTQFKGWKLKWNFPFRSSIKAKFPALYKSIQKYNEKKPNDAFAEVLKDVQPDVIHCFEMKLAGLPILETLNKHKTIPLIYSSWGSDLFCFENLGVSKLAVDQFLKRTNYLVTDCKRDYAIAKVNGYENKFLGVYPGNGGLQINKQDIKPLEERNVILVKGYDDGVGKAIEVLKAIELIANEISMYKIVIYSADTNIEYFVKNSFCLAKLDVTLYSRYHFLENKILLTFMGQSIVHVANSISDGMPNALLEAMAMGSFPIQSNPGEVTEEVITHGKNGFLIQNPLDVNEISKLLKLAIFKKELRQGAKDYNVDFMNKNYNRSTLQPKIVNLYNAILD